VYKQGIIEFDDHLPVYVGPAMLVHRIAGGRASGPEREAKKIKETVRTDA
jgi:hypothetical protein